MREVRQHDEKARFRPVLWGEMLLVGDEAKMRGVWKQIPRDVAGLVWHDARPPHPSAVTCGPVIPCRRHADAPYSHVPLMAWEADA